MFDQHYPPLVLACPVALVGWLTVNSVDVHRRRVILFGGKTPGLHDMTFGETWEWDGVMRKQRFI